MPGDVVAHRFQVLQLLGKGGMGVVFSAADLVLGREVAVKMLPGLETATEESLSAFEREARALAALKHASIVPLYDYGSSEGTPFLVMELIDGRPLSALIATIELGDEQCVDLVLQAARALMYAHRRGVLHRDIKPRNIMVEDDGRLRLIDFGIAHLIGTTGQFTRVGQIKGTPEYMAPECLAGAPPSVASDIYSLGRVLAQLFWSRPVPVSFRPSTPEEVRELVLWMTQQEPANRPCDMSTVVTQLDYVAQVIANKAGEPLSPAATVPAASAAPSSPPIEATRLDVMMTCSSLGSNHLEVVLARPALLRHLWWSGEAWSDWVVMDELPDGGVATAIAAGSREPGHQDVFAVSSTGRIYRRTYIDAWLPWESLPAPPGVRALVTSSLYPGHIEVFALTPAGIKHSWWSGEAWSDWVVMDELPDGGVATAIAAGSREPGHQDVFAVSSTGRIYRTGYVFGGCGWEPWRDLASERAKAPPPSERGRFVSVDKAFERRWNSVGAEAFDCLYTKDHERQDGILEQMRTLVDESIGSDPVSENAQYALCNYAEWLGEFGHAPQAVEQLSVLIAELTRLTGPDDIRTLAFRSNRSHWLGVCGQIEEAIAERRVVLHRQCIAVGPGDEMVYSSRVNLAEWLAKVGLRDEASVHARLAVAHFEPADFGYQWAYRVLLSTQSIDHRSETPHGRSVQNGRQ